MMEQDKLQIYLVVMVWELRWANLEYLLSTGLAKKLIQVFCNSL